MNSGIIAQTQSLNQLYGSTAIGSRKARSILSPVSNLDERKVKFILILEF
jgi:hypothetical protein